MNKGFLVGHRFLSNRKEIQNQNKVPYYQSERSGISYSGSLCNSLSIFSLSFLVSRSPLVIPPSIHHQSIQRDLTYISLCPSFIHCKVNEINLSLGRIHTSFMFTALGLLLLLLPLDRSTAFPFTPPSFSTLTLLTACPFYSPQLWDFWPCITFKWRQNLCKKIHGHSWTYKLTVAYPSFSLSISVFSPFSFSAGVMTHLSML